MEDSSMEFLCMYCYLLSCYALLHAELLYSSSSNVVL